MNNDRHDASSPEAPILIIAGTRPEAIKLAPVVKALRAQVRRQVLLVATGQHHALFDKALNEAGLVADVALNLMRPGQSPAAFLSLAAPQLTSVIAEMRPALTIVQGDTASAYAGALAAFRLGLPIGHVEAGLRTPDIGSPFPEELFRRAITRLTNLHFAPTQGAAAALIRENVSPDSIYVTGNTGIDHLLDTVEHLEKVILPVPAHFRNRFGIVTVHRRENRGERLNAIAQGLSLVSRRLDLPLILPLHPAPELQSLKEMLKEEAGISVVSPFDYRLMIALQAEAALVLTDSGGMQEEAVTLGTPVVVLREETERYEAVLDGRAHLAGANAERIATAATCLLSRGRFSRSTLFGDGKAGPRIANAIADWLDR